MNVTEHFCQVLLRMSSHWSGVGQRGNEWNSFQKENVISVKKDELRAAEW